MRKSLLAKLRKFFLICSLPLLLIASEEELIKCSKEPDEIKRLNCYDLLAESIHEIEDDKRVTKPII